MNTETLQESKFRKVVQFIPYKTLTMDLEAILSELSRMYLHRNDVDLVELIALSDAELYPVGSFDDEAQKYEYTLKLAVPVKFFNHLRTNIENLRRQLFRDISLITAPYIHEFISEVFLVVKIEQDALWRERVLDFIEKKKSTELPPVETVRIVLFHAEADTAAGAAAFSAPMVAAGYTVTSQLLDNIKEKDLRHLLHDFEKTNSYGVLLVSSALLSLPLTQETRDILAFYITQPEHRTCMIWDSVSRVDVADFNGAMARSLAYTTERMTMETITDYVLELFSIKRPEF